MKQFAKVSLPVGGRAGIQTQAVWHRNSHSLPHTSLPLHTSSNKNTYMWKPIVQDQDYLLLIVKGSV